MASAGKVAVGKTTVYGGSITLVAYAAAVFAFLNGARDEATISALVVGTLSLLMTLGGRYAQAFAHILTGWKNAPPAQPMRLPSEKEITSWGANDLATREVPGGGVPPEVAA